MDIETDDILPPHEGPIRQTSLRLPRQVMERLDWISKASGYSRTDVVIHIIRWGCGQLEKRYGTKEAPIPGAARSSGRK